MIAHCEGQIQRLFNAKQQGRRDSMKRLDGKVALVLGRKPEAINVRPGPPPGAPAAAGRGGALCGAGM